MLFYASLKVTSKVAAGADSGLSQTAVKHSSSLCRHCHCSGFLAMQLRTELLYIWLYARVTQSYVWLCWCFFSLFHSSLWMLLKQVII